MQSNLTLDLCNSTPSWWLGWVGWGRQARQFGFTTLAAFKAPSTSNHGFLHMLHRKFWNYICCRVFLSFILSAFHKRSKCCLSPCDGVCDLVHGRMGLLVGMPVWRGNYSSNMVACPVLSWTSLLSAYLHFTAAGAEVITCAHRAQGCAHNLSRISGIHAILESWMHF